MESKLAKTGAKEQWQQNFSASWPLEMFAPACSEHLIMFSALPGLLPSGTQLFHCKNSHRETEKG